MNIVKFKEGTYGVRKRGLFGYKYCRRDSDTWWRQREAMFPMCKMSEDKLAIFYTVKSG